MTIVDVIGWIGAASLLLAYFLLSRGTLNAEMRSYHLMNLVGGVGLGINTYVNQSYPATLVNILWTIVAIYSLVKLYRLAIDNS